jgi:ApaG protein
VTATGKIRVEVKTQYLREHSNPDKKRFAFGYHVVIFNQTYQASRLLSRHWIITDGNGKEQEISGQGVVGEQPLIQAGRSFSYRSGTILQTPVGSMQGSYKMIGDDGVYFDAIIPPFRLAMPELVN